MGYSALLSGIGGFAKKNQPSMASQNTPNLALISRRDRPYIENLAFRFCCLSNKGIEAVEKQMNPSQSETPTASTVGVSVVTPESALSGGSATQALIEQGGIGYG